jgi:plastocyanin
MNKNLLIGLGAIILIAGVAFAFTRSKDEASEYASDTTGTTTGSEVTSDAVGAAGGTMLAGDVLPTTATVTYDGNEFTPSTLTVMEGTTVTFKNESDQNMWIGSNDHPTHTLYPEKSEGDCLGSSFDECAAVGRGGEWSFTFDEVGTWGYHNHAKARNTGTVVVQTEEQYLSTH